MKKIFRRLTAASLFLAAMATPAMAQNLNPDFTYQGRLQLSGQPVTGSADFQYRLFDASSGGVQVGPTISPTNANLVDGLFQANLDFGAGSLNGDNRWLEIAVRSPSGTGNFVILTPRQRITGAPYAHKVPGIDGHSLNSANGSITDALFVNNNGLVGIGTSSPLGKLDVVTPTGAYFRVDNVNGDLHVNGGNDKAAGIFNDSTGLDATTHIVVNNGSQMVINGGGGVGIGTVAPLRRLHVVDPNIFSARFENLSPLGTVVEVANPTSNAVWEFGVAGSQTPFNAIPGSMYFYKQGEVDVHMTIAPNAWVGLGVTNPGFRLDLPNIASADGRGRANRWDTYSSERWKENIQVIDGALDKVMQLRGVTFDWKPEYGGAHDVGFIAEEVGQIVPELVTWEADGENAKGLAYDRVTALTVEAIKEQQKQIKTLTEANADLKARLEKLEAAASSKK